MGAIRNKLREERGVVFILVIVALGVLLAFAALALDVGNLMVVRNELQNISDGAALAAGRRLGSFYEGMSWEDQQNYTPSASEAAAIRLAARDVGISNKAEGISNVTIKDPDIEIGRWYPSVKEFHPNEIPPDAVRVTVLKDGDSNSRVVTYFARIFGMNELGASARAVAALTAESTIGPGKLSPIGIDQVWFDENFCGQPIKFYPSNSPEGCAGWNVFFGTQISAGEDSCPGAGHASEICLRRDILETWLTAMLENPTDPSYQTPPAEKGQTFQFTGGTLGDQTFTAFYNLWDYMRKHDGDDHDSYWTTSVVVYENASCENPQGARTIAGFATVQITEVMLPPVKEIRGIVECKMTQYGRGGGGEYGTHGSIPNLVQ